MKTKTKKTKPSKTMIFYPEDFRSKGDGYHLDVWDDILAIFELPKDTAQVEFKLTRK